MLVSSAKEPKEQPVWSSCHPNATPVVTRKKQPVRNNFSK